MARPDQHPHRPALVGLGCALAVAAFLALTPTRAAADDVSPPAATTTVPAATDPAPTESLPTPDRAPTPDKAASTPKKTPASKPAVKPAVTPVVHATTPTHAASPQSTGRTVTPPVQTPTRAVVPVRVVPQVTHQTTVRPKAPTTHRAVHKTVRHPVAPKAKPTPAVKHRAHPTVNAPVPLPAVLPTEPAEVAAKAATPLLGLTLLVLGIVAILLLGLAAAPVGVLRSPAIVWLALRGRPVLGAVGFSLLSAVVILYLLTETGA
jgi:hypothetical protein